MPNLNANSLNYSVGKDIMPKNNFHLNETINIKAMGMFVKP